MTSPVCPAAVVPPSTEAERTAGLRAQAAILDKWQNYIREHEEWVDKSDIQEAIVEAFEQSPSGLRSLSAR